MTAGTKTDGKVAHKVCGDGMDHDQ
jgi:hypothetical protein